MIGFIKGIVEYIGENKIIVENNGIGYNIFVSSTTISKISSKKDEVKIYTYMNVKDDGISLYGFLTTDEINMFNLLIGVSSVGPKVALAILSNMSVSQISLAIITNNDKEIAKTPGVGKKTAQRIILELKDKIKTEDAINTDLADENYINIGSDNEQRQEAIEGLLALGFSRSEVIKAVSSFNSDNMSSSEIIKIALKKING